MPCALGSGSELAGANSCEGASAAQIVLRQPLIPSTGLALTSAVIVLCRYPAGGRSYRSTACRGTRSEPRHPTGMRPPCPRFPHVSSFCSSQRVVPIVCGSQNVRLVLSCVVGRGSGGMHVLQAMKEARATIAWWQDRQAKLSQRLSQKRSKLMSSALRKLPLKATQARR